MALGLFTLCLLIIWLVQASAVCWWLIATVFSIISGKFKFQGKATGSPRLIFQVTSRNSPYTVQRAIASIRNATLGACFDNYEIWVVTDESSCCTESDRRTVVVTVPSNFQCIAEHKARALEYARQLRVRRLYDGWIYFMDEENWITEQTVAAVTSFAAQGKSYLASGPLMFATGGSTLSWLADAIRTSECRFCHLGHALQWWPLHGENLLMHSRVERDIGWDRVSLLEDAQFAACANNHGYKTGWHGGELYSTSPTCLSDMIIQRRRWFGGMIRFLFAQDIRPWHRVLVFYWLLCGLTGSFLAPATAISLITNAVSPALICCYVVPVLSIFPISYYIGCSGTTGKKLMALALSPLFVAIEGVAAWWSLLVPPTDFDIISKA